MQEIKNNLDSIELLAPAGNMDSFIAAINGGADAVYLGLKEFSARKRAQNFSLKELEEVLKKAHKSGVKVYITFNTLVKDKELEEAVNLLNKLLKLDIDGIIIQDMGILSLLKDKDLPFSLQISTQASVYGNYGIKFFSDLGVDRVVFARESSLNDITKPNNVETKAFCHGALCYAYSGQCHLSSAIGGRSGNRGNCAQPCRKFYTLSKDGRKIKEGFLLSTKELNTLDHIKEFKKSHIDSLKIEGRLRSPEYVYAVSKAYRNALNDSVHPEDREDIEVTFSRDFTDGLIFDARNNLSQKNPKRRGKLIGKTGKTKNGKIELVLNDSVTLINGDGISFGENEAIGTNISSMYSLGGRKIKIGTNRILIPINEKHSIKKGTPVFRSYDKTRIDQLRKEALKEPEEIKTLVNFFVRIKKDDFPSVHAYLDNGIYSFTVGDFIPQAAKTKSVTSEDVAKQFKKLGNTSFAADSITVDIDDGLFLPKKQLNSIRNQAIENLEILMNEKADENKNTIHLELPVLPPKEKEKNQELSIFFEDFPDKELVKELEVDEVVLNLKQFSDPELLDLIKTLKGQSKKVLLTVPTITNKREVFKLDSIIEGFEEIFDLVDGILIPSYDFLEYIKPIIERHNNLILEAGESLNVYNRLSSEFLKENGFNSVTVSEELSSNEIRELSQNMSLPAVMNIAGRRKLMISENCIFDCKACSLCKNEGWYDLVNDFNDSFRIRIEDGKNIIYNAQPSLIPKAVKEQPYVKKFRINITDESPEEIKNYVKSINMALEGQPVKDEINPGNYRSGVI